MQLLTQRDAAKLLKLSERTLERLRVSGTGPRYVKANRSVRYRAEDIERWLASKTVSSTSAVGGWHA
jgi:predicted DNA-binding transcriptional regulator AlpA